MNYEKEPLHISTSVPNGTYEVTVTVTAHEDMIFTILSQSRRFMAQDIKLGKGESTDITFNVSVCDYHKNNEDYTNVNGVEIDIMCDGDFTALSAVSPVNIPTVYIAGDSTVTDQPAEYPYNATSTYCGWGQMFPQFLNTGIAVENHAQSGSTTEDFKNVNFTAFKDKIKKGDFLIIEFGHNDQKIDTLDAFGGYTENLKYFVNFVREKGANPIICSPINRIIFQEDGTLLNLLGDYRTAVKNVCDEMNVPFIDLWSRTTEFFEATGAVKAWDYFWGNGTDRDYTHTNDIGGNIVARFVANEMIKNNVQPIADLIKKDMINVEMPKHDSSVKPQNSKEIEHLKTIGLVNVPKASELAISIDIEDFPSHDRLASYCGLAPRNRQSGTSISSVTASRQGNKRLKNLLIFSCNCLTRTEGRWGDYYTRCRERGMSHGKALKALARKRLKVIYAVMRDRVPYAA